MVFGNVSRRADLRFCPFGESVFSRDTQPMRPTTRRELIVDLVRERERITVEDLARELAASPETIRRDLTDLAGRGVIRKFHGGAAATDATAFGSKVEGAFQARMQEHLREKRAIARPRGRAPFLPATRCSSIPAPPRWSSPKNSLVSPTSPSSPIP